MRNAIAQLVAVFLLLVQGLAALGPGRVLCMSGASHAADHAPCQDHPVPAPAPAPPPHAHTHCHDHDHDHDHGLFLAILHSHDDCGCHVHVPVQPDDATPTTPRDRTGEPKPLFTPLLVAILTHWDWTSAHASAPPGRPPDRVSSAQLRALSSTRLRI